MGARLGVPAGPTAGRALDLAPLEDLVPMPVLPIIDALILLGWSSLFIAFLQKAIMITTSFRPVIFGMHPVDFLMVACTCLLFALALAARTWVKEHEPAIQARRRRARLADAGYEIDEMPDFRRERADEEAPPRRLAGY
jgi:hypothetical protein